ncbi:MAG: mechanosensitive ion channel family protein [Terriglobales bacterium]
MQFLFEKAFLIPLQHLGEQFGQVLPSLVTVVFILIIGGAVAYTVRYITYRLLQLLRFDRIMAQTQMSGLIMRSGMFRSFSDFAGRLVQGLVWLLVILMALTALDTEMTRNLVLRFVNYLPDIVTAVLVILLGSVVSKFLGRSALLAAVNAQWAGARMMAGGVRLLVMSLAVVVALEQVRIGRTALLVSFAILFAGVVLAVAVAFGTAGRDLAKEWLESRAKGKAQEEEAFHHL